LAVLVLVAGAYYFGTKNKTVPTPVASAQPSSSPLLKPTADSTANWKTYFGNSFELKYPANFSVDTSGQYGPNIYLQTMNPNECTGGGCSLGYRPISITIEAKSDSHTLAEISKSNAAEIENIFGNNIKIITTNSSFAGSPSITLENQCLGYCRTILVKTTGNILFTITELYGNKTEFTNYSNLANQILSTFKFTK
jgi:hypothetical protein